MKSKNIFLFILGMLMMGIIVSCSSDNDKDDGSVGFVDKELKIGMEGGEAQVETTDFWWIINAWLNDKRIWMYEDNDSIEFIKEEGTKDGVIGIISDTFTFQKDGNKLNIKLGRPKDNAPREFTLQLQRGDYCGYVHIIQE